MCREIGNQVCRLRYNFSTFTSTAKPADINACAAQPCHDSWLVPVFVGWRLGCAAWRRCSPSQAVPPPCWNSRFPPPVSGSQACLCGLSTESEPQAELPSWRSRCSSNSLSPTGKRPHIGRGKQGMMTTALQPNCCHFRLALSCERRNDSSSPDSSICLAKGRPPEWPEVVSYSRMTGLSELVAHCSIAAIFRA